MSIVWVECWKCDECGFRWIRGEIWPDRCASSKCRKRSWNKLAKQSVGAVDPLQVGHGGTLAVEPVALPDVEDEPVADVSALSLADKKAVALAAIASAGKPKPLTPGPSQPAYSREPCPYTEPDLESGDVFGCSLTLGHKGRHARGAKVGDIW